VKRTRVEAFARNLSSETTGSVRSASVLKIDGRTKMLASSLDDSERARTSAAEVKDYVLDNLSTLLV